MKFGVREIVDVVFKAADNMIIGNKSFKKYQPVFMIDTATTSSLEQATTTVYAQGGKGYARLIAWEGEKTMTFTVTDALMSPMGLSVLTGAGLIKPSKNEPAHVHVTINKSLVNGRATVTLDDLIEETGLDSATSFQICNLADVPPFATKLDGSGAGIDWYNDVQLVAEDGSTFSDEFVEVEDGSPALFDIKTDMGVAAEGTVQLDFYLIMNNPNAVTEVDIEPSSFGGYFYVEAQTLFRREDTGKDMAAELIIPKAKVQSAFTFTMAASGDPSTFDFVMDAMPGYVRFDRTKKLMCKIQVLGSDNTSSEEAAHTHTEFPNPESPTLDGDDRPDVPTLDVTGAKVVNAPNDENKEKSQANQNKLVVSNSDNTINVKVSGGVDSLNTFASTNPSQGSCKWIALDINTGESDITKVTYNGTALTQDDVDEASSVNLPAGHFVLWLKAEVVKATPRVITLGTEGKEDTKVIIKVA